MLKKIYDYLVSILIIISGILYLFIPQTMYFGGIVFILGIFSILSNIFYKEIDRWLKKQIESEKNIKLRERFEMRNQRNTNILFALVISGSFASSKIYKDGLLGLGIFLVISIFYVIYDRVYLERYMDYTDYLINNKSKKKRI